MKSNEVGAAFPQGQLASAFVTALTHEDPATRSRADERVRRWLQVLAGMASGAVTVGSRTPMAGLPAWVTPQVIHGGFATGTPAAAADDQGAAFAHYLTDAGQALRRLMAATYLAFRNRRSLLLLDLQHQVRLTELPWVRALRPHRRAGDDTRREAHATLRRVGELSLDGYPATLLPNPLVRELAELSREADADLPWVEELAADIFMGEFSAKFPRAARLAGELLTGSLYARYYDIDYPALSALDGAAFDELCRTRAGVPLARGSVAANGKVIEQAQILTTHNLATLAQSVGVTPVDGWAMPARRTFATVLRLTARVERNPRPLPLIKDIAYAWRQLIFYLSLSDTPLLDQFHVDLAAAPDTVRARLRPALVGLGYLAAGGWFADGRTPAGGHRLLGWTTGRHWMREPVTAPPS